ncbi:MAG: hypothetical protein WAX14_00615 [Rhodococcus sp. (in: high G+C Gram-positive bacteria)]|uniref:hypothetical protein n=1 Tax=Rhodococcus sp. TaxID=1831 RepID=UPI003BB60D75
MKPYLRVLAGMFAGITLWLAVVALVQGTIPDAIVQLMFAVGLTYLAVGKPIRDYRARQKARYTGLAARAEAGHRAYLAGDPAAFASPPPESAPPTVRRGVVVAGILAAVFVIFGIISDISDGFDGRIDDTDAVPAESTGP